jgi:hypothetical protein
LEVECFFESVVVGAPFGDMAALYLFVDYITLLFFANFYDEPSSGMSAILA